MILSYRQTAPAARASSVINQRFFSQLRAGAPFLEAWRRSHSSRSLSWRWAALCFEESVDDTMRGWIRAGSLASQPDPLASRILYFDQDTLSGREVVPASPRLDCWLTERSRSERVPPLYLVRPGAAADLHIRLLEPTARFEDGDAILVIASQVRPDYAGPFEIESLFRLEQEAALVAHSELGVRKVIHGESAEYGNDTYRLLVGGQVSVPSDPQHIILPIRIGSAQNDHLPLFYFHVGVLKGAALESRIGLEGPVEDWFQYGMFRLPWPR